MSKPKTTRDAILSELGIYEQKPEFCNVPPGESPAGLILNLTIRYREELERIMGPNRAISYYDELTVIQDIAREALNLKEDTN